jgi:hypothetical protein
MSRKLPSLNDLIPRNKSDSLPVLPSVTAANIVPLPIPSPRNRPSSPIARILPVLPVLQTPPSPIEESGNESDNNSEGEVNYDFNQNNDIKYKLSPIPSTPKFEFNAAAVVTQKATTPLRVMALSDKTNMMSTYAEMLSSNTIENQLESHKYVVLDRIITNENGVKVNYIKAYDPNGVIVFIMMDTMGNVPVKADDIKSLASIDNSSISVSDKNSALVCSGTGICGVALICRDEICIIIRVNDGATQETSYRSNDSTMTANNTAIPFVIIKMSEITSDPEGTLNRSFDANERMTKASFNSAVESLSRTIKKAELLGEAIKSFYKNRESAYDRLMKDKTYLSSYTRKYYSKFTSGTLDAESEQKYVNASANLYARNKIFNDLVAITNGFSEEEEKIEKVCNIVIELNNTVVKSHDASAKKILTSEEINRL